MAVAFMANAQHLIYRKDILEKAGVPIPTTYEDMLAGAKVIRDKGLMQYPLSGAYKSGWNLAQEFINMYIGYDGDFYKPGTAEVSINNAKGVKTLETLKALTQYMNPDFLTHDSNAAAAEWEAGKVAMMNFWGSRTAVLQDDKGSTKEVYSNTLVSGPLTVGGGKTPATTLWWDGFTVAKNISDEKTALSGGQFYLIDEKDQKHKAVFGEFTAKDLLIVGLDPGNPIEVTTQFDIPFDEDENYKIVIRPQKDQSTVDTASICLTNC